MATVVVISYSGAQKKARDAKRKSDLSTIQSSLDMYNVDNGHYPNYSSGGSSHPDLLTAVSFWTADADSHCGSSCLGWNNWIPTTYLASMPVDPTNTYTATYNYYGYTYTSVVDKFVTLYGALGAHYKYALTARMENSCTSGTDANCVTPDSGSGLNATNGIFQDWMYDGGANYLILGPKS